MQYINHVNSSMYEGVYIHLYTCILVRIYKSHDKYFTMELCNNYFATPCGKSRRVSYDKNNDQIDNVILNESVYVCKKYLDFSY